MSSNLTENLVPPAAFWHSVGWVLSVSGEVAGHCSGSCSGKLVVRRETREVSSTRRRGVLEAASRNLGFILSGWGNFEGF